MNTNNNTAIWFLPPSGVSGEDKFSIKISGTTYDVTTRFSIDGRTTVLKQFMDFILRNDAFGLIDEAPSLYDETTFAMPGCRKGESI